MALHATACSERPQVNPPPPLCVVTNRPITPPGGRWQLACRLRRDWSEAEEWGAVAPGCPEGLPCSPGCLSGAPQVPPLWGS
eukprot:748676-Alexandrium_andersonii.AAC.1